ncbi:PilZ domain-containing protein [Sphingomonas sp. VNH70]|uniref:PilZ domain-containing protein n=1 Tax=Sphingomonas silueang TaxID=3156617 RepID=UPI0032B3C305
MFAAEYEPAQPNGRRRSPRAPVSLDADLGRGGLDRTLCKVVDISVHGVRIQTYSALAKGAMLWLTLPGIPGPRAVRVVRAGDYDAGCEFIETLEMDEFERLLELNARRH